MTLPDWIGSTLAKLGAPGSAGAAVGVSLLMVLASLVAIPWLLCRLPEDYLDPEAQSLRHGVARRVVRNTVGGILLILGVLMLVLPGQGVLTIIVALTLLDFPGKRRLLRKLLARPRVLKVVNSVREKFHKPALVPPDE